MMNPLLAFANLGGPELIVILVLVLILFGAKKLPELARGLGQSMNEFRKARDEFDREITRTQSDLKIEEPKDKEAHKTV
jgi:sec-independent protein translocase protein TatA